MDFLNEIRKIPPVTRFLCLSTIGVSVPVMAKFVSVYDVLFVKDFVTQKLQLWRIPISFFLASSGINFIFDMMMIYRTSNQLEEGEYSGRSPDYAWQLSLASLAILGLNIPLKSFIHTRAMILAITYLSCSLSPPGSQTSLFGLFSIPVVYLPYALIGMDAAMGGPAAAAQGVSGAIVGHLWWWSVFDSRALADAAKAPGFVRALVSDGAAAPEPAPGAAPAFGTGSGVEAIRPRARAGAGTGGGGGNAGGYQWGGSGHRLGTD